MKEAIILAGGLGTRLRPIVNIVPKVMAPIDNRPFLEYVLLWLEKNNVKRIILATGYKHNVICDHFGSKFRTLELIYSVEKEPLGTGGAIKLALESTVSQNVIVINGDTFFNIDIREMYKFHNDKKFDITIALKPMTNFDRYGEVNISPSGQIVSFKEKEYTKNGLINGGVFIINKDRDLFASRVKKFSFEKEFLEKYLSKINIGGYICDEYFIDIGIPKDYFSAHNLQNFIN